MFGNLGCYQFLKIITNATEISVYTSECTFISILTVLENIDWIVCLFQILMSTFLQKGPITYISSRNTREYLFPHSSTFANTGQSISLTSINLMNKNVSF